MFLNSLSPSGVSFSGNKQRGFLIPLAAFIIVAMGLMALTISRTTTQTSLGTVQEQASLQAFYAAESGAQYGMNQLFYQTTALTVADVNNGCSAIDSSTISFNVVGLRNCSATLACNALVDTSGSIPETFYFINSTGSCDFGGGMTATREVSVSAQFK